LALGKTVFELLREIPASELAEWAAFYQLEPWGCEKEDVRTGTVASTIFNSQRSKRSQKIWKPTDFMVKELPSDPQQDHLADKITASFRQIAARFKAKPQTQPQKGNP